MLTAILLMTVGAAATVDVWFVRDQDTEPCDSACWKSLERHIKSKPGVRKVDLEQKALKATLATQGAKIARLLNGLEGFKVEMRAGYKAAEVRIDPDSTFPPLIRPEADTLVLPLGPDVKTAIEQANSVVLQQRLKCIGNMATPASGEIFLTRFQQDGSVPASYLPFAATPDFDGDGKPDLYLRMSGLPEMMIMGKSDNLKVLMMGRREPDEPIRCDVTPDKFVRVVKKKNVHCSESEEHPKGDAVERVSWNQSSDLLFYNGTRFVTCMPASSGSTVEEGFEKADKKVKLFKHGQEQKE